MSKYLLTLFNIHNQNLKRVNRLDLTIFLKDGTKHKMEIGRLRASGINENNFFIEIYKEDRIEVPLDSIDGFKIESKRTYLLHESDEIHLITAVGILSKYSV